jgi:hypothetical protein
MSPEFVTILARHALQKLIETVWKSRGPVFVNRRTMPATEEGGALAGGAIQTRAFSYPEEFGTIRFPVLKTQHDPVHQEFTVLLRLISEESSRDEEQPSHAWPKQSGVSHVEVQTGVLEASNQHAIRLAVPADEHHVRPHEVGSKLCRGEEVIDIGIWVLAPETPYFPELPDLLNRSRNSQR